MNDSIRPGGDRMTTTSANRNASGEPLLASIASWAVLAASFGLSATTWIAMAVLAGFTETATISGITLKMAWLMPISVDGYVVVALVLWMSPVPQKVANFAKWNTYFAAGTGIAAQSAYHLLITASVSGEQWRVVMAAIVGALPPTLAGLAIHMRALIRRESAKANTTNPVPTTAVPAAPAYVPAAAPTTHLPATDTVPARPAHAPVPAPVPTPDVVAPRIASRRREDTRDIRPTAGPAATPERARSNTPKSTATPLTLSSTDRQVTATQTVQLPLPMFSEARMQRARELAKQHHDQHGSPITAGILAVRLRIPTEQAAQLLAHITAPTSAHTVNGHEVKAA